MFLIEISGSTQFFLIHKYICISSSIINQSLNILLTTLKTVKNGTPKVNTVIFLKMEHFGFIIQ